MLLLYVRVMHVGDSFGNINKKWTRFYFEISPKIIEVKEKNGQIIERGPLPN